MVNRSGYIDKRKLTAVEAWSTCILVTALGEWAARCARQQRKKCPTCRCMRPVWPDPGPCMCCISDIDYDDWLMETKS